MIFSLETMDNNARTGTLHLPHGDVETPAFMPVGTQGSVKALYHKTVEDMGYQLILGNTYHLYLRPGEEVIEKFGGLHKFSNWDRNILTDSGGFQVFSLAPFRKIEEGGIYFRSHIDGSYHRLSPEKVVDLQRTIGSDILMQLDVCTEPDITYKKALGAVIRTTEWAKRSYHHWSQMSDYQGKLFGIIQGNFYPELRKRSAEEIQSIDFPGIAIGGLSVGESYETFCEYLALTSELLDDKRPRYVMGIGTPEYILEAVENGIDMFDCVYPTRIARNGTVFTKDGLIALKKVGHAFDDSPIQEGCSCTACTKYSRGFMRHMFKAGEMLGPMLATEHNLQFLYDFMQDIRDAIRNKSFSTFKKSFIGRYKGV